MKKIVPEIEKKAILIEQGNNYIWRKHDIIEIQSTGE